MRGGEERQECEMVRVSSQPACLEGRNVPDFSSVCSPAQHEQWPFVVGRWFTGNHPSSRELNVARLTVKTKSGHKRKSQGFRHETIRSEGLTEVNAVRANSLSDVRIQANTHILARKSTRVSQNWKHKGLLVLLPTFFPGGHTWYCSSINNTCIWYEIHGGLVFVTGKVCVLTNQRTLTVGGRYRQEVKRETCCNVGTYAQD